MKKSTQIRVLCRPDEKARWLKKFGKYELSKRIREMLDSAPSS